jgi:hypothetical protein
VEQAVQDVTVVLGERRACKQLGIARTTFQRHRVLEIVEIVAEETTTSALDESNPAVEESEATLSRQLRHHLARQERNASARASFRALNPEQRQAVLDAVHQTRFTDRSVPYIYATLLDENHYCGSISTMYRVLRSVGEVGERRDQATRPAHVKPELCATGPNQVYTWDITKLHGPQKWTHISVPMRARLHQNRNSAAGASAAHSANAA